MFARWNMLIQEMPVTLLIWPKVASKERWEGQNLLSRQPLQTGV